MVLRLATGALAVCLAGCVVSFDEELLADSSFGDEGSISDMELDARPGDLNGGEGKAPLGGVCTEPDQCSSGFCVDGVCCEAVCGEKCHHCNFEGLCVPVPDGEDYNDDCAREDVSACQQDGRCDGAGSCRLYASGTICDKCQSESKAGVKECDGKGSCLPSASGSKTCTPYRCDPATGACYTSCTSNSQCLPPASCKGKSCK